MVEPAATTAISMAALSLAVPALAVAVGQLWILTDIMLAWFSCILVAIIMLNSAQISVNTWF